MHYRAEKVTLLYSIYSALKSISISKALSLPSLLALDGFAISFSFLAAFYFRDTVLRMLFPALFEEKLLANTLDNIWWLPLIIIFCLFYENLYQKRMPIWKEVEQILKATTLAVAFAVVILYMSRSAYEVSRTLMFIIWVLLIITLPLFRYYGKLLLAKTSIWRRPVLIIGAGKTACLIASALQREKTMGYAIEGIINDRGDKAETVKSESACHIPIIGDIDQVEAAIKKTGARDIFLAMPSLPARQTVELANYLQPMVNNVVLIPDLFGLSLSGIEAQHFFEEQVLMLNIKNRLKPLANRFVKRLFDLLMCTILLILFTPLLIIIALAVKIESKGPIFYNAIRIGQGGSYYKCHKFRTMRPDSEEILSKYIAENEEARQEWEEYRKLINYDPRLTRIGRFMRRFSLDELPQLLNVAAGEMSLVGPRPYMPSERELMGAWHDEIVVAKPGITGLWQVSGRNLIGFDGRMKLGAWYIKNWSLWLDMIILLRTVKVVLKGEGAY